VIERDRRLRLIGGGPVGWNQPRHFPSAIRSPPRAAHFQGSTSSALRTVLRIKLDPDAAPGPFKLSFT